MSIDNNRILDPELQKDLSNIIKSVEQFVEERDSVLLSLLRQRRLPELFENCDN